MHRTVARSQQMGKQAGQSLLYLVGRRSGDTVPPSSFAHSIPHLHGTPLCTHGPSFPSTASCTWHLAAGSSSAKRSPKSFITSGCQVGRWGSMQTQFFANDSHRVDHFSLGRQRHRRRHTKDRAKAVTSMCYINYRRQLIRTSRPAVISMISSRSNQASTVGAHPATLHALPACPSLTRSVPHGGCTPAACTVEMWDAQGSRGPLHLQLH